MVRLASLVEQFPVIMGHPAGGNSLVVFDSEFNRIKSTKDEITIVTKYFSNFFRSDDKSMRVQLTKVEPEYTADHCRLAANKLKNNKAVGCDEISAEVIKMDILNNTNKYPLF